MKAKKNWALCLKVEKDIARCPECGEPGIEWIKCTDRLPKRLDTVAFVVKSKYGYDGRVLAGYYGGKRHGKPVFTIPGIEFEGSFWMPLPKPTKK